jgi:FkbM family methyltransferase
MPKDDHLILDRAPVRVKACRRGVMMYLTTDPNVGRSLDRYGEFSEGEALLFEQFVRSSMTVLDIGANIGAHTVHFAKTVGPTGRVIAFEPQRLIYQMLCGNIALNGIRNTITYNAALGREAGTILVPQLDPMKEQNFGGLSLGAWAQGESVPLLTLDSLQLNPCNFVKLDVEGMERQVLEGAVDTLSRHQPVLYVENDRSEKSAALIQWLMDFGYRLYWHLPPLHNPRNYFSEKSNIFQGILSVNMLCTPKSLAVHIAGLREITAATDSWR